MIRRLRTLAPAAFAAALAGGLVAASVWMLSCAPASSSARGAPRSPASEGSLDDALRARAADRSASSAEGSTLRSPRALIIDEEPWTYAGREGRVITTPHFRLHTTVTRSLLLERAPNFIEIALASYRTVLGELPEPGARLDTFLMGSRPQWESITRAVAGEQSETYLRIPRGGFALGGKGVYYDIGPRDTLSIAAHEGWHQYTQSTFKQPLPLWLEEGIAAYFEGFRWDRNDNTMPVFLPWSNPQRFDVLRKAHAEDRLIPLSRLLVSRPQDLIAHTDGRALTYYAQVWALAHFLHEGEGSKYRADLERLLQDAASGDMARVVSERVGPRAARRSIYRRIGDAVFRAYFTEDLDAAQAEYDRFVRTVTLPGTRGAMTAGESPLGDE